MKSIESIEQWEKACKWFKDNGYYLWQMQYAANEETGFHAWFAKEGVKDIEIVTHNTEVHKAIVKDFD